MDLNLRAVLSLVIGLPLVVAAPSHAAVVSGTYSFTGSQFTVGAPRDPVSGAVTISYNTATDYSNSTAGISFTSADLALGSTLAFSYLSVPDTLIVGGTAATAFTADPASPDFALLINNASTTPTFNSLSYSTGAGATYFATNGAVRFSAISVPEPGSLLLVSVGLAGVGLLRRRSSAPK